MPTGIYPRQIRSPRPCKDCGETDQSKFDDYIAGGRTFRKPRCRNCIAKARKPRKSYGRITARHYELYSRYGLTELGYDRLVNKQEGKCAICKQIPDKRLYVDHDKVTGKVRGLLCNLCNLGIGHLRHNPSILSSAKQYIEESHASQCNQNEGEGI